jgi:hypothetical protein
MTYNDFVDRRFLYLVNRRLIVKGFVCLLIFLISAVAGHAQNAFASMPALFTPPKNYVVQHTSQRLIMDGRLEESDWQHASWTTTFEDIEGSGKPLPTYQTRVKMLWNDSTLFIAADLQEPQVWATQTQHDDIIFKDNDFEVFIDPDNDTHGYFEIEVNAINKIFDLFLPKPYRNGGDALVSWDVAGLKSAVKIDGTLNKPNDIDKGWIMEMAIPLKALRIGHPISVPEEGAIWRINFSRVEWDTQAVAGKNVKLKDATGRTLPEHNWVWSPQGVIDMHYPERWGYLQFTRKEDSVFELPYTEHQKQYLWLIYYKQKQHFKDFKRYAGTLKELGINPEVQIMSKSNQLDMVASAKQFVATIEVEDGAEISIDQDGLVKSREKP